MKRARVGDVYYVKVPNGYKLYQWAYKIPRKGDYIRVFDGLFDTVPENIEEIIAGPESYIISFYSGRAYRIGLAHLIGNYPVPRPFPEKMIGFYQNMEGEIFAIDVQNAMQAQDFQSFNVSSMAQLPKEYQDLTLLNSCVTPNWLLYLFDINFNLNDLIRFFPTIHGKNYTADISPYTQMVNEAMERDREKRISKK